MMALHTLMDNVVLTFCANMKIKMHMGNIVYYNKKIYDMIITVCESPNI